MKPIGQTEQSKSRRDRGAGLVEYALLIALLAVACLASINVLGGENGGSISKTASSYGAVVN